MDHNEISDAANNLLHGFSETELAEMLAAAQAELMKLPRCPQCPHCATAAAA